MEGIEGKTLLPEGKLSHPDLYKWVSDTLAKLDKKRVTDAFLYSLGSGDLKYRPHIANYVFLRSIPKHELVEQISYTGSACCKICLYYTISLSFTPLQEHIEYLDPWLEKWGGIWGEHVWEATYFLNKFLDMPSVKPSKKDFDIFKKMTDITMNMPVNAKPRDLEKAFSKIIKSNKGQREMLIDILGRISLLETGSHKGYFLKYVYPEDRAIPRVNKIDWIYPVGWWRGENGINKEAYGLLFNEYPELRIF